MPRGRYPIQSWETTVFFPVFSSIVSDAHHSCEKRDYYEVLGVSLVGNPTRHGLQTSWEDSRVSMAAAVP